MASAASFQALQIPAVGHDGGRERDGDSEGDDDEKQTQNESSETMDCNATQGLQAASEKQSGFSVAENAKHRLTALELWQSCPFNRFIFMRMILQPVRVLMNDKTDLAAEDWEDEQHAGSHVQGFDRR